MIAVQNLSFTYAGAAGPAVKGLDFEIERGEILTARWMNSTDCQRESKPG